MINPEAFLSRGFFIHLNMEFGKVSESEIDGVNFLLPPDGAGTKLSLSAAKNAESAQFFVGCAKWGRKEWKGLIYPPKTKEVNFLDEYVKHFNSIELNAAFYSMPKPEMIQKWRSKAEENATEDFLFCPKFPQLISHLKKLRNAEEATDQYIAAISGFGDLLGPCFLQLSDQFGPQNLPVLEAYLKLLPVDFKVFVELRHQDWFTDKSVSAEVFNMLSGLNIGAAITDASGRRDVLHMNLSTPEAFIRFVGNGAAYQASDFKRIDDWVLRLKSWLDQGLNSVYFFLHQHDEKDTPVLADYTIRQFNMHLGSKLKPINFLPGYGDLFG